MELEELVEILEQTGLPVAYLAFPEEDAPAMPFIVYQDTGSNNKGADNRVWHSATRVQIDLFTPRKDRNTERLLETALNDAEIYWERENDFNENEKYYRAIYEIEI